MSCIAAQGKPKCMTSGPGAVSPCGSALQMTWLQSAQGYLYRASLHGVNIPECSAVSL